MCGRYLVLIETTPVRERLLPRVNSDTVTLGCNELMNKELFRGRLADEMLSVLQGETDVCAELADETPGEAEKTKTTPKSCSCSGLACATKERSGEEHCKPGEKHGTHHEHCKKASEFSGEFVSKLTGWANAPPQPPSI